MYMIFYLEELACYKQYLRGGNAYVHCNGGTLCHKHNSHIHVYVRDQCKTRTVLKPSDGFEAGQTVLQTFDG